MGGIIEKPGGLPGASLDGTAGVQEQGPGGVPGFESRDRIANAAEYDGQLVVEVVRGGSSYSARAMGFVKAFHKRMVTGETGENRLAEEKSESYE